MSTSGNSLRTGSVKTGKKSSRLSLVKPFLTVAILVGAALAVALFLAHRSQGDEPPRKPIVSVGGSTAAPTTKGWTRGNPAAKTVLIEFADFQCGSCARASVVVGDLLKKHADELLVVFKQFPLETIHRNALIASQAAEAAGKQYKFWEMYELLFKHQVDWANVPDAQTFFLNYAAELQLDLEKFQRDLWDSQIRDKIYKDVLEGQMVQVTQTPTFFLNGTRIPTTKSEAEFEQLITDAIRKAK